MTPNDNPHIANATPKSRFLLAMTYPRIRHVAKTMMIDAAVKNEFVNSLCPPRTLTPTPDILYFGAALSLCYRLGVGFRPCFWPAFSPLNTNLH